MMSRMLPINKGAIRRIHTHQINKGCQDEAQKEQDQFYDPEIQQPEGF